MMLHEVEMALYFYTYEIWFIPAGTYIVLKTSSRQCLQDVQNVNSEDARKT